MAPAALCECRRDGRRAFLPDNSIEDVESALTEAYLDAQNDGVGWLASQLEREKSTMNDKLRSLRSRFPSGLRFHELKGETVIFYRHLPFELEPLVLRWIDELPEPSQHEFNRPQDAALTADGWSSFVSWMVAVLRDAQGSPNFEGTVLRALADEEEFDPPIGLPWRS